jgi:hypothetical protein
MRRAFPHCDAASICRDRFGASHSIRLDCDEKLLLFECDITSIRAPAAHGKNDDSVGRI